MGIVRLAGLIFLGTLITAACSTAFAGGITGTLGGTGAPAPAPPPSGPEIANFTASCEFGTVWTFSGVVQDYDGATEITVNFSNLPSLDGKSVPVNPDGSFVLTVQLAPGEGGTVYAQAVDNLGQMSAEAEDYVIP